MSLELYSLIPGQQVKRDRDLSNVTIQCDPRAVYPNNPNAVDNRFREREAGKVAVEDDICDLNVANLTVRGKLTLNGEIASEICNIFCPDTFSVAAVNQINMQALGNPSGDRGNIALIAGSNATIEQTPGTADDCIILSAASAGTQTQSADSHIMITAGEGNCTQERENSILISAAGANDQLQQAENSILLTTNNGAVTQGTDGEILLAAQSAVAMIGVTDGIGMGFDPAITTDNLKMSTGGATTQDASVGTQPGDIGVLNTGGAVQAVLTLRLGGYDFAGTNLAPGTVTANFTYFNDKITTNSNVLTKFNSGGSVALVANVHFDIQVVGIAAGRLALRVINIGSGTQSANLPGLGPIGTLNVLVINPLP